MGVWMVGKVRCLDCGGSERRSLDLVEIATKPMACPACGGRVDYEFNVFHWHWVTDRLCVGGRIPDLQAMIQLKQAGITHVLSVASEADDARLAELADIEYLLAGCDDDEQPKAVEFLAQAIGWALRALEDPMARVYIHCYAGARRSMMVALGVLCALGMRQRAAMELLLEKRPAAQFVPAYVASVEEYLRRQPEREAPRRTEARVRAVIASGRRTLLLCVTLALALSPIAHAQRDGEALSPVVQVAANYGPGKSTMISGFVVGRGAFVLTQANILDGAYDTAVAFTNGDVIDPVVEHVDERFNLALLRISGAARAYLTAAAELPTSDVAAIIAGVPEAFVVGRASVRLLPDAQTRRWRIVPDVPRSFRGAPILNATGELLGIALEERGTERIIGVPTDEFFGAKSRIGEILASTEAEAAPETPSVELEPTVHHLETPLAEMLPAQFVIRNSQFAISMSDNSQFEIRNSQSPKAPAPQASNAAAWEELLRSSPGDVEVRLTYAEALMGIRDYYRAVQVLEATQAKFSDAPGVYWMMAIAYWQRAAHKPDGSRRRSLDKKSYVRAKAAFEYFLEIAPNDWRAPQARDLLKMLKQADYARR